MMSPTKKMVDDLITSKAVFVVSKSFCPYCRKTRGILKKYKIDPEVFEWLDIDKRDDCEKIRKYMARLTGARSVPRVFIGGKFVGGGDEIEVAHRNGELAELLQQAGALRG
eukprot:GFUD01081535.1.p2 GENE.GFUD01081535.1~~GFUD01081535.1.p2  ORF type:complete len:111 (+),score=38.90 GFUD01081535.1:49-381(+)